MFFVAHVVSFLATPLAAAAVIGLAALASRLLRWKKVSRVLVVLAVAIAYVGALPLTGNLLLTPLERRYPPLPADFHSDEIAAIAVLGSNYVPRTGYPITSALDEDGLARIVEGIRLAVRHPQTPLILSGGAFGPDEPAAWGYARLVRELAVIRNPLLLSDRALDTGEEAVAIREKIGMRPFVLVTSAYHMPRAMRLMERARIHPIPAPTDHRAGSLQFSFSQLLPSSTGLRRTERAIHEYLGLAAMALGAD